MKPIFFSAIIFLILCSAFSAPQTKPIELISNWPAVQIGNQIWMANNWDYRTPRSWYFDNDSISNSKYGRLYFYSNALYNAPKGWHLPTLDEWNELINNLGGDSLAIPKLFADKASGIHLMYGGNKSANISPTDIFNFKDLWGFYWTATPDEDQTAYALHFTKGKYSIERLSYRRANGFSVRYIKDKS